jgi:hypothetical protein
VRILKGFKSCVLEVRILQELQARFVHVQILQDLVITGDSSQPAGGRKGKNNAPSEEKREKKKDNAEAQWTQRFRREDGGAGRS